MLETINIESLGVTVKLGYDQDCHWMYDELWYDVTFISNHRDYADKGNLSHLTIEHILDNDIPEGYEAVPVSAYIHGGIALTVSETGYPFNCRWDSGTFGFLLFKTGEFGNNNIGLDGFVKHWQAVLNGEIYYYIIEDENDVIESCGGYDDYDDMKNDIDSIIEGIIKERKVKRQERLKTMIRHRVPLEKRIA
jgi:hypothetical protein